MSASSCELFRHFTIEGVDPFEVRRRAGRCRINAFAVLDLTDRQVREALDVDEQDLVEDVPGLVELEVAVPRSTPASR